MKSSQNVNSLLEMFTHLSDAEQAALADQILAMLASTKTVKTDSCSDLIHQTHEKPDCPFCGAKAALGFVVKRGMCKGSQRYGCKSCGRYFVPTTGTAFARTRKNAATWRKFIQMTISGKSIQVCADECGLALQTAFTWRHKILNTFVVHQNSTKMSGKIEIDEMLLPISYKGNHVKGGFQGRKLLPGMDNGLPREAFKRGTDNHFLSSNTKACVFCMVKNGNEGFYAAVPGVGYMKPKMLKQTVGKHVEKERAHILADHYQATAKYLEANNFSYELLASNVTGTHNGHIPEVRGENHLQHINAMHRHLRLFLEKYYGVSSKYLHHYVALYTWLKNLSAAKQERHIEKISISRMSEPDCHITRQQLEALPSIPQCA